MGQFSEVSRFSTKTREWSFRASSRVSRLHGAFVVVVSSRLTFGRLALRFALFPLEDGFFFVLLFFVCFAFCGFVLFAFLLVCARSRQLDSFMDYVNVHTSSLLWLFMHINSISGK